MCLWYLRKSCGLVAITSCCVRETQITISLANSNLLSPQDKYIHLASLEAFWSEILNTVLSNGWPLCDQGVLRKVCLFAKNEGAGLRPVLIFALCVTIKVLCGYISREYIYTSDHLVTGGHQLPKQQHGSKGKMECVLRWFNHSPSDTS